MVRDSRQLSLRAGLASAEPKRREWVAFAIRDDNVAAGAGPNSPFTRALPKHITEANLDIRLFFAAVRNAIAQELA